MKILVCGLGSIGQRHVRILCSLLGSEAELGAVRRLGRRLVINDDLSVIEGVDPADHLGIRSFASMDEGLAWGPAAVFVTNPISMHVETARMAIEAGSHVFIEKPLSHTDDGVDDLFSAARRQHLVLMVGYQLRHHPALALMRRALAEGEIGRVCSADIEFGEYLPTMHAYEDYRDTHMARRDQGGGALLCLSHEIDALCWLFGAPASVLTVGGHLSGLELSGVEDVASMMFTGEFDGRRVPLRVHLDFLQRPPRRQYRILGEAGAITFDYNRKQTVLATPARTVTTDFTGWHRNQMFEAELSDFLACMRGESDPAAMAGAALATHRVCMAAARSLQCGQVMAIDPS
jgi:predicted dehydrogenase